MEVKKQLKKEEVEKIAMKFIGGLKKGYYQDKKIILRDWTTNAGEKYHGAELLSVEDSYNNSDYTFICNFFTDTMDKENPKLRFEINGEYYNENEIIERIADKFNKEYAK